MTAKINVVVYEARMRNSERTGKDYVYQTVEIQQAPERPNASFQRFYKSEADALTPGSYTCEVRFYVKGYELVPVFTNFVKA